MCKDCHRRALSARYLADRVAVLEVEDKDLAQMTLMEIARLLGAELLGNGDQVITGMAGIDEAMEGELTFVANPRYRKKLASTNASAAIVPPDIREAPVALLVTPAPYLAFSKALEFFYPPECPEPHISKQAWIDPSARLEKGVTVFPFAYVGKNAVVGARTVLNPFACVGEGVIIGEDCRLYPNVSVCDRCILGDRVILHSGVIVGADGFGFAQEGSRHLKIPQVGIVRIGDDVEIGAGSCIDRATMGETLIGRGTKIDNLVQVAHNVTVGEDVILVSQVGVSGSTVIGDRAVLGGQVGVAGHLRIGNDVKAGARSAIHSSVLDGKIVAGVPAMPYESFLKTIATFKHLPRLRERVIALEKEVEALKASGKSRNGEEEGGS